MAAYIIVRVTISDPEAYREYMKHTPRIIRQHGGKMIVRGGATETLEGADETQRLVILEFPSMEAAKAFYNADDYQAAKALRQGAGEAQFTLLDGYPQEDWDAAVAESGKHAFPGESGDSTGEIRLA